MREITYRDLVKGLRALGLDGDGAAIVHASLSAFGRVAGGADAVVGALLRACHTLVMPAFTFETMVTPPVGPVGNALEYGRGETRNAEALLFTLDLPVSRRLGAVAETFRGLEGSRRSTHPILSFAGRHADEGLAAQTLEAPLAPIEWLERQGGDVLLLGVDHTANTAIHLAEQRAGRKRFIRWALTAVEAPAVNRVASPEPKVVVCPNFPGCADGFGAVASRIAGIAQETSIGAAVVTRVPLTGLLSTVEAWIRSDPLALLCTRPDCERCAAVRRASNQSSVTSGQWSDDFLDPATDD